MHALFVTLPASGHFHPLVPLAKALQAKGHRVTFASAPSFVGAIRKNGFEAVPAGAEFPEQVHRMNPQLGEISTKGPEMFLSFFADAFVRDLVPFLEHARPDVVIRDALAFGPDAVAEKLGIPHANVQVGGGSLGFILGPEGFAQRLNRIRALVGLAPEATPLMPLRYLNVAFVPERYFRAPLGPTTHHFQLAAFDTSGDEQLPAWVEQLGERPLVYATLGTVFNKLLQPLVTIAEGLRDEPLELAVTVGRDQDPAALGPQPSNVHVERYIPQTLLLPRCRLAVLHGGFNSALSALQHGLPMVLVPLAADQPVNAARCQELGVARVVHPSELTPQSIREAVRAVLSEPAYRENAKRFAEESARLPGMDAAVSLVERLAHEKRPLTRSHERDRMPATVAVTAADH